MDAVTPQRALETGIGWLNPADVETAGLVLCDLDGCLISEGRAFADAAAFAQACGARLWVVSNRSDTSAEALSATLAILGLRVPAGRILLAGEVALERMARVAGITRISLFAAAPLADRARALGMVPDAQDPQAVLLCRDPALTVDGMAALLAQIESGLPFWVANEDLSHPGQDGHPVAETGALLAALRAIRPGLTWTSPGKPDPLMLHMALERTGLTPADAVFVGDNAATDGRAARAANIPFLHLQRRAAR